MRPNGLRRDIRYTLAPPDRSAMKIGGSKTDIHTERPSVTWRPATARVPTIQKMQAYPAHAR